MHVMRPGPVNRVRERRESRGMSQMALAAAASLTRQSVGAIEAGRAMPGVDVALRVANALDSTAEELFGELRAETHIAAEPVGAPRAGRVALAELAGRWVAYPLSGGEIRISADGIARVATAGQVDVEPVRPVSEATDNVVVMGCAAALGLIADRLNARNGPGRFIWMPASSTKALAALAKRQTHVAGVHLVDARSGEANVPDVRRHAGPEPVVLVTLARWEAGLLVAAGNPKKLRGASDLARRGLRLVSREVGSGARRLLERELRAAGLSEKLAGKPHLLAAGHLEVAQAVSIGAADVGIATRDAAIAFGLHFIPLAEERYDLVLPLPAMDDPRIRRLLDVMTASAMRRELASLGYDVRSCGDRVAELSAA